MCCAAVCHPVHEPQAPPAAAGHRHPRQERPRGALHSTLCVNILLSQLSAPAQAPASESAQHASVAAPEASLPFLFDASHLVCLCNLLSTGFRRHSCSQTQPAGSRLRRPAQEKNASSVPTNTRPLTAYRRTPPAMAARPARRSGTRATVAPSCRAATTTRSLRCGLGVTPKGLRAGSVDHEQGVSYGNDHDVFKVNGRSQQSRSCLPQLRSRF